MFDHWGDRELNVNIDEFVLILNIRACQILLKCGFLKNSSAANKSSSSI